jgi:autotransporter adhesin
LNDLPAAPGAHFFKIITFQQRGGCMASPRHKEITMRDAILFASSMLALGTALGLSTPAQAQQVCDLADGLAAENTGGAVATGAGALACGGNTSATGDTSIAIGNNATAGPVPGSGVAVVDHDGVAIGDKAKSTGFHSTAIGGEATASGAGSQAFGWKANATGTQSVAVGNQAQATATNTTALGNGANASGVNSTAIGQGSNTAGFANSVALGTGTVNTAANQVNVGGRTIGGVAAGVLATDAVNMAQLNAAVGGINSGIAALQGDIGTLFDLRHSDRRDMKQGVASAMALTQSPMPSEEGGISYALNGAMFRGEYAMGASLTYRLHSDYVMAVSLGASFAGNKNNGARVGVSGEF